MLRVIIIGLVCCAPFSLVAAPVMVLMPPPAPVMLAQPTHLSVPRAGVEAEIVTIGITDTGNLDVPPNLVQAGWYQFGPTPGAPGNAVIDGHVGDGGRLPGVFNKLHLLKLGDDIVITLADGTTQHFTVSQTEVYDYTKFPAESVFLGTAQPVLKIITCHGQFVPKANTYSQRLIVTAVLKQ